MYCPNGQRFCTCIRTESDEAESNVSVVHKTLSVTRTSDDAVEKEDPSQDVFVDSIEHRVDRLPEQQYSEAEDFEDSYTVQQSQKRNKMPKVTVKRS